MFSNFTTETCTGTGATLTLSGATTGNIPFSLSFADGDLVSYALEDSGGTIKVAGIGTYNTTGDTITRNDTWNYNGTVVDKNPATNITLSGGTHTVRCDVVRDSVMSQAMDTPVLARYRTLPLGQVQKVTGKGGGEFTSSAGAIMFNLMEFNELTKISQLGAYISTTQAGGLFRQGIYICNNNLSIGALLVDSGDIGTDSAGATLVTLTNPIYLSPGLYYFANVVDNTTATADGARESMVGNVAFTTNGSIGARKFRLAGTYGALPSSVSMSSVTDNGWGSFEPIWR